MRTIAAALLYCILYPVFGTWYVVAFIGDIIGEIVALLEDLIDLVHP